MGEVLGRSICMLSEGKSVGGKRGERGKLKGGRRGKRVGFEKSYISTTNTKKREIRRKKVKGDFRRTAGGQRREQGKGRGHLRGE